jgi:hypothetical protein
LGGQALSGPDGKSVWVPGNRGATFTMDLVGVVDGQPTGTSIDLPADLAGSPIPDETGYFIVPANGGAYLAQPSGLRRISTGTVLAAGPTRTLSVECDATHTCTTVVLDRRTGARRVLPERIASPSVQAGVVAPNGRWAALLEAPGGTPRLRVLDLDTGAQTVYHQPVGHTFADEVMVWSPDSAWLFVVTADGQIVAIDPVAHAGQDLGVTLPPVVQVAVRPAG